MIEVSFSRSVVFYRFNTVLICADERRNRAAVVSISDCRAFNNATIKSTSAPVNVIDPVGGCAPGYNVLTNAASVDEMTVPPGIAVLLHVHDAGIE